MPVIETMKTETLEKQLHRYKEKLEIAQRKETEKVANLGFGYGMRAYHRLKVMSFSSDNIKERIQRIENELKKRRNENV